MKEIDKSIFWNLGRTLTYNRLINFIVGNRGGGKTFGAKERGIDNFIKKKEQFGYIRRYKDDLKKPMEQYFDDIKYQYPDYEFKTNNGKFYIRLKPSNDKEKWTENDVAGYGWSISGLSCIELRNRNYYYDDEASHSVYDSSESVYALDGIPIIASSLEVSGYDYATTKGNILIKKHFTDTGVLSYFTVLFPDGSQGTFGKRTNSLWRTSYPLTEIKDIDGNIITFNYSLWSGHYYITSH